MVVAKQNEAFFVIKQKPKELWKVLSLLNSDRKLFLLWCPPRAGLALLIFFFLLFFASSFLRPIVRQKVAGML